MMRCAVVLGLSSLALTKCVEPYGSAVVFTGDDSRTLNLRFDERLTQTQAVRVKVDGDGPFESLHIEFGIALSLVELWGGRTVEGVLDCGETMEAWSVGASRDTIPGKAIAGLGRPVGDPIEVVEPELPFTMECIHTITASHDDASIRANAYVRARSGEMDPVPELDVVFEQIDPPARDD